jgi:hypothetical protein
MENEIYISKDGKFIIYNNLISGIGEKTKELEFNSLIEVFKKQSFFLYENKEWGNSDLITLGRKLIYEINNSSDIILEYEKRFQNLITESIIPYVELNEQVWDWIKNKTGQATDWIKNKTGQATDWIKNQGLAWIKKGVSTFFNSIRSFLYSPAGIAVDVALTAIGVGKVASMVVWGALLCWEIYEMTQKGVNFETVMNVLFAAVGILIPALAKTGKVTTASAKNIEQLAKTSVGGKLLSTFKSGLSAILNGITKGIEWLSGIFGSKIKSIVSGALSGFKGKFNEIIKFLTPKSALTGKKITTSMVGQAALKGVGTGLMVHGVTDLIDKGVNSETGKKAIQYAADKLGYGPSEEDIENQKQKAIDLLSSQTVVDNMNNDLLKQLNEL